MTLQHGINISTGVLAQAPPIDSSTVIGIVGVSTAGTPAVANNVPVAVHSLAEAEEQFGTAGTLYEACEAILAQSTVFIVGVLFDDTLVNATLGAAFPTSPATGDLFQFNAAATGLTGAEDSGGTAVTDAAIGDQFMYNGTSWVLQTTDVSRQGAVSAALDALATSETATGHKPSLIGAPDETYVARDDGSANSVAAKLESVAEMLDAIAFADAANDTVADATDWDTNNGATRVIGVPQEVTTPDRAGLPGSGYLLGAQAALDAAEGSVRATLSNKILRHISSVSPAYTFSYRHASQASQLTDDKGIMVIVRHEGVWRGWGGETSYGSATDPRRFYATQRILDAIENHVVDIAVTRLGLGIRSDFIPRLVGDVQDYLDGRVGAGDIAEASVAPDAVRNTVSAVAAGRVYLTLLIRPTPISRLIEIDIQIG